jgi:CheY-like chemotaxis protein
MKTQKPKILYADDDKDSLDLISFLFQSEGFQVETCVSLEDCLLKMRQNQFDAIILDNRFGERTSPEICKEIRSFKPNTPIVFYIAEARQTEIDKALNAGGNAYLIKPNGFENLTETVNKLIQENGGVHRARNRQQQV